MRVAIGCREATTHVRVTTCSNAQPTGTGLNSFIVITLLRSGAIPSYKDNQMSSFDIYRRVCHPKMDCSENVARLPRWACTT